jgi:xylulokinase
MDKDNSLYLGLDLSTQSLKATVINSNLIEEYTFVVNFERDLPQYMTKSGYLTNEKNEYFSNVNMFMDALELAFSKMKEDKVEISRIKAISGCAQQHGCVFYSCSNLDINNQFDMKKTLTENFEELNILSSKFCPIWMDCTTTKYARNLEEHFTQEGLFKLTGNRAYERFTINQIQKLLWEKEYIYRHTFHISLLSSFMSEILSGKFCGIDLSDGSGMNLLNITSFDWDEKILNFIGNDLKSKLYPPVKPNQSVGLINNYFIQKYGFSESCKIFSFTGDNICSFMGTGTFDEETLILSLGTSDTLFFLCEKDKLFSLNKIEYLINSHLFVSPINYEENLFVMLCTRNGSILREKFRDEYCDGLWSNFEDSLSRTIPGNNGIFGFFYIFEEIVPSFKKTNFYYMYDEHGQIESFEKVVKPCNIIRAVIEGKILSLYCNLKRMGFKNFKRIILTGGGAKLKGIDQIVSDIFDSTVLKADIQENCSYGGALKAFFGDYCEKHQMDYDNFDYKSFYESTPIPIKYSKTEPKNRENYINLIINYLSKEANLIGC